VLKIITSKKEAELQWPQNPSHTNGENLNNAKRETGRTFREKRGNI